MHLGAPCTPRKKPKQPDKTVSTSKKKLAYWPCPDRQFISKSCDTTTARRSVPSHSVKVIWSCAGSRNRTGSTSCPHHGEGPFVVSRALNNNSYYLTHCTKGTKHKDTSGRETECP